MTDWHQHTLTGRDFDDLALGPGSAAAVDALTAGQISRRTLLVLALSEEIAAHPAYAGGTAVLQQALDLLDTANAADAVSARASSTGFRRVGDRLLLHPYLEVWAVDTCQRLVGHPDDEPAAQVTARTGYLLAGAVAAAGQAGLEVEADLMVPAAGLAVPGWGRFTVENRQRPFAARLSTSPGTDLVLRPHDGRAVRWEPVHRLDDAVVLEDTDPYRNTFGHRVHHRLASDLQAEWVERYARARALIRRDYPDYGAALDVGLVSVTPLVTPPDKHDVSASARQAFGAVSSVLPRTPTRLALLLLHEFQHVKLGALIDLVSLHDPDDGTLYHAPWRPDPRPLGALLQGTYAHLGVADFWRRQYYAGPDPVDAGRQFQHWTTQVREVLGVLAKSPALNEVGRRFVAGMAAAVEAWE